MATAGSAPAKKANAKVANSAVAATAVESIISSSCVCGPCAALVPSAAVTSFTASFASTTTFASSPLRETDALSLTTRLAGPIAAVLFATATTRADLEVPLAATGVDAVTRARTGARTTCIAACV